MRALSNAAAPAGVGSGLAECRTKPKERDPSRDPPGPLFSRPGITLLGLLEELPQHVPALLC